MLAKWWHVCFEWLMNPEFPPRLEFSPCCLMIEGINHTYLYFWPRTYLTIRQRVRKRSNKAVLNLFKRFWRSINGPGRSAWETWFIESCGFCLWWVETELVFENSRKNGLSWPSNWLPGTAPGGGCESSQHSFHNNDITTLASSSSCAPAVVV